MAENLIKLGGYVVQGVDNPDTLDLVLGTGVKATVNEEEKTITVSNDETVLWEGSAATDVTLSESVNNFERVLVIGQQRDNQTRCTSTEIDTLSSASHVFSLRTLYGTSSYFYDFYGYYSIDSTGKIITLSTGGYNRWANADASGISINSNKASDPFYIRKVVGINRKQQV